MDTFDLIQLNLFSPMVGAFALGILATLIRSDLRIPDDVYTALSIYLLLAIGLRGGAELSQTSPAQFWAPALASLVLGVAIPLSSYAILRYLGKFEIADAGAIAAHFGSVSAVTFSASLAFLDALAVAYEGFMPTIMTILEIPGILVALTVARLQLGKGGSLQSILHEVLTGKSMLLLIGGLAIGFLGGHRGMEQVAPFFVAPFKGVLTIFLLELGIVAARRLGDFKHVGPFLIGFSIVGPVTHGLLGVALGTLAGLSLGGSTVLGVLAASASYIAAPAAARLALPQANPSYYLTASLGVAFPFNLTIGLPLYYGFAQFLHVH
ncbi:MAG: sodium-dependent bicarbonate transport family permease [Chloroflexota bacterium]